MKQSFNREDLFCRTCQKPVEIDENFISPFFCSEVCAKKFSEWKLKMIREGKEEKLNDISNYTAYVNGKK